MKRTTALLLATLVGIGLLTVTTGGAVAADAGTQACDPGGAPGFCHPHQDRATATLGDADVGVNNCNGPPPQFEDEKCP